jgi:putative copper export protein
VTPDLLSVIVRALAFVALFQAAGVAFFLAIFGRELVHAYSSIRRLGLIAAAAGVVLVLAHLSLDATRMAGDFTGLWDANLQHLAWDSGSGISQIAQVIGLLVIVAALALAPARTAVLPASAGAVIATGAFVLTGHTSAAPLRFVLAPLLALHLLVVAFWFGALVPLAQVTRTEAASAAAQIVRRFSAMAGLLVPLIGVAGITLAALLAKSFSVLHKPYGELLLVKLTVFMVLLALAAFNKWKLAPALPSGVDMTDVGADAAGAGAAGSAALRRSIAAEYLLIVAVLSVTAVLTAFFSPD